MLWQPIPRDVKQAGFVRKPFVTEFECQQAVENTVIHELSPPPDAFEKDVDRPDFLSGKKKIPKNTCI
jgi:hypothetical protein